MSETPLKRDRTYKKARAALKSQSSSDVCALCGGYIDKLLPVSDPMSWQADHIIPLEKGGSNALDNLQPAHKCCNIKKSDKLYVEGVPIKKISQRNYPQVCDII